MRARGIHSSTRPIRPAHELDGKTVKKVVPRETKALLDLGEQAIGIVKETISSGAGNIAYDLNASQNRGFEKLCYTRACTYHAPDIPKNYRNLVAREAAQVRAGHGGNCDEHALLAGAELNRLLPAGTPLALCRIQGLDHSFVVVGDLEGDRAGLVVVDAWPTAAQAVVGGDFKWGTPQRFEARYPFQANGEDVISKRVKKVRNADGDPAAEVEAPAMPGARQQKVWVDTHVTANRLRIRYRAEKEERGVVPLFRRLFRAARARVQSAVA